MYGQPNYYGNQFYQPMRFHQPMQPVQPIQPIQQPQTIDQQQVYAKQQPIGIQGKSVDSIEVVKAMDIPLDGSISYFPLTDGTAIVTKQLQMDGTSKTIVYKPIDEQEVVKETPKYVTENDLQETLKKYNNSDLKDELKNLKKQVKNIVDDIEDLKDRKD